MEENRSGYRILVADDDANVHQSLTPISAVRAIR